MSMSDKCESNSCCPRIVPCQVLNERQQQESKRLMVKDVDLDKKKLFLPAPYLAPTLVCDF